MPTIGNPTTARTTGPIAAEITRINARLHNNGAEIFNVLTDQLKNTTATDITATDAAAELISEIKVTLGNNAISPSLETNINEAATEMNASVDRLRGKIDELTERYKKEIKQQQDALAAATQNTATQPNAILIGQNIATLEAAKQKLTSENIYKNPAKNANIEKAFDVAKKVLDTFQSTIPDMSQRSIIGKLKEQKVTTEQTLEIAAESFTGAAKAARAPAQLDMASHRIDTQGLNDAIKNSTTSEAGAKTVTALKEKIDKLNTNLDELNRLETIIPGIKAGSDEIKKFTESYRNALAAVDNSNAEITAFLRDQATRELIERSMQSNETFALTSNLRTLNQTVSHELGTDSKKEHQTTPVMGYGSTLSAEAMGKEYAFSYRGDDGKPVSIVDKNGDQIKLDHETQLRLISEFNAERMAVWEKAGKVGERPKDVTFTLKNGKLNTIHCHDKDTRNTFIENKMKPEFAAQQAKKNANPSVVTAHVPPTVPPAASAVGVPSSGMTPTPTTTPPPTVVASSDGTTHGPVPLAEKKEAEAMNELNAALKKGQRDVEAVFDKYRDKPGVIDKQECEKILAELDKRGYVDGLSYALKEGIRKLPDSSKNDNNTTARESVPGKSQ